MQECGSEQSLRGLGRVAGKVVWKNLGGVWYRLQTEWFGRFYEGARKGCRTEQSINSEIGRLWTINNEPGRFGIINSEIGRFGSNNTETERFGSINAETGLLGSNNTEMVWENSY